MSHHYETCEGILEGLYLPCLAWDVLRREDIQTIDQLRAIAGQLERFVGIGSKTAQAIRLELDRIAAPGEQTSGEGQLSAWAA
jgi:Holliday junction resolvasome RuvABC DNA-binding subunit